MDDGNRVKPDIPSMMGKLDEIYAKEEALLRQIELLTAQYDQLQEDKEMLQNFIMYQSNKNLREQQATGRRPSVLDRIRRM